VGVKIPGVQQVVNVGSSPNDGTGDALRDAMVYINENFTEIYSIPIVNTNITVGNSTVNCVINSISITVSNASSVIKLGNSSSNSVINSTGFYTTHTLSGANAVLSTNTLTLGTSTAAANGYTWLPNGLKLNWGWVSANNSTGGNAIFSSAFTTACYSVTATSNTPVATYQAGVTAINLGNTNIRTANATSTNVFYMAIGK
jgi:hypothetical protein